MEDTGNGKMWFKRVAKVWTVALRESCHKIKAGRIYTWENCQVVWQKKSEETKWAIILFRQIDVRDSMNTPKTRPV